MVNILNYSDSVITILIFKEADYYENHEKANRFSSCIYVCSDVTFSSGGRPYILLEMEMIFMIKKIALLISIMMLITITTNISVMAEESGYTQADGTFVRIPPGTNHLTYDIWAVIKPEYESQAPNMNAAFLLDELGIDCVFDVQLMDVPKTETYLQTTEGKYLDIMLNLKEEDRERANEVFHAISNAEWFDVVIANWFPTEAEDTSLPLNLPTEENFSGGTLSGYVKFNFSEESLTWDADYLNSQLGIDTIQKLWPINIQKKTGRGWFIINLTDGSKETATMTAQKLYDTGWFYSIECINFQGTSEPGLEKTSLIKGDANEVDILDVIAVNKHIMVNEPLTDEQKEAADVNQNGEVDEIDSLMILKEVVEITKDFVEK